MREDLLRPLRSTGPGLAIGVVWERRAVGSLQTADLAWGPSYLLNRFSQRAISIGLEGRYQYLRRVIELGADTTLSLGGRVRLQNFLWYHVDWDDSHLYWLTGHDMGPAAAIERRAGRFDLTATLSAPLLALVSRPAAERTNKVDALDRPSFFFTEPNRQLRLATVNQYRGGSIGLTAAPSRREGWWWRLSWQLDYHGATRPRAIHVLQHRLGGELLRAF